MRTTLRRAVLALLLLAYCWSPAHAQPIGAPSVRLWTAQASGSLDAAQEAVTLSSAGMGTLGVQVTGTFTATLVAECSLDGSTYQALRLTPTSSTTGVTSVEETGIWTGAIAGCSFTRVRVSAYTDGAAVVTLLGASTGGGSGGGGGGGSSSEVALITPNADSAMDDTNDAVRVNVVAGSASGATDNDDASIAAAQTGLALGISQTNVFDGSVWRRFTVGTAGTASAQVVTVQGISSMTPLLSAQSGTWNITNVSGTVSLPTGAATAANQTTIAGHVDGVETTLTAIETATEASQASLASIENALSADAIEGNAAIATGPQTMLKTIAAPSTVDDGDAIAWRGSNKGDAYTYIRDAAGNERGANVNASNQLLTASTLQAGSALVGRVQLDAQAANGADGFRYTSAGSTEDEHAVKASTGVLYSITVTNTNAAARYLRCANAVAGSTTPGSTTPIIDLAVPGATTGAGFTTQFPMGLTFSTALTCWLVTGAADTDVTEVAANELKVLYTYK